MSSRDLQHGYGGHRRESFSRYYKRMIVSEGCGCAERVLDLSNRPRDPLSLVRLVAWLVDRCRSPSGRPGKPSA